jgi:hypothetical protein
MINNVRRIKMVAKTKRSSSTKYKRSTPAQLKTLARQWQRKFAVASKPSARKTTDRAAVIRQQIAIKREIKLIAFYLRAATTQQINAKLKTLRSQMAKRNGVAIRHTKANSPAAKRLELKLKQIQNSNRVPDLIKLCAAIKLASFKNPRAAKRAVRRTVRKAVRKARRTTRVKARTARRATRSANRTIRRTTRAATRAITRTTRAVTAKYKSQAKALKKEISKLKLRNASMKKLVAKFRKEVAQLQRHYGTFHHQKPRLVHSKHTKKVGQEVSNIVKFSNALSNAFAKQA